MANPAEDGFSFQNTSSGPLALSIAEQDRQRLQMGAMFGNSTAQAMARKAAMFEGGDINTLGRLGWSTAAIVGATQDPGRLMGGIYDSVRTGGFRMQGPATNYQPINVGNTAAAPWVAQQMFQQVEGRLLGGANGYSTGRIGSELLPSLSNRGLMAGVTGQMNTDSSGQTTGLDAGAGKMVTSKIIAATDTLAAMRDVFGDRHMSELAKQAELITGMNFDASSVKKLQQMGSQIRKITDVASAMGTSAQELMDFTQRLGSGIAQDLMAGGMNATSASRAGSALAIDNVGALAGTKRNYNQARALAPNGGDMPDITDQEFGDATRARVAKGAAATGSQQFVALQNVMLRNTSLTDQQKTKMQSMLDGFGSAKDKASWAQGVDGYLRSAIDTDSTEISKVYGLGDVGQEGMSKWNSDFLAHSDVNKDAVNNLMQRGKVLGVLKKGQMNEGMTKLASTFFSSFDANTQKGVLDAADQGGAALSKYMTDNKLTQFLPSGTGMNSFAGMLTGENRKALRGLMSVGTDSAEAQAITNRQINADVKSQVGASAADRIVNGRAYTPGAGWRDAVQGALGLRDPNNPIDQMDTALRDTELRKGMLTTHINGQGGLSISAKGAAELQKTTGMDLFAEMNVKAGDYEALSKALGTNKFQEVAGKFQKQGGNTQLMSALDMSIQQVGASYDSSGNMSNLTGANLGALLTANGLKKEDFGIAGATDDTILQGLTQGHAGGTGMDLMRRALKGRGAHDRMAKTNLVWANSATLEGAAELMQNGNNPDRAMFTGGTDNSILGGDADMRDVTPVGKGPKANMLNTIAPYSDGAAYSRARAEVNNNAIAPDGKGAVAARGASSNGVMHVEQLIIKNATGLPGMSSSLLSSPAV